METSEPYRRTPEDLAIKAQREALSFDELVERVSEDAVKIFLRNSPNLVENLAALGEYPAEVGKYDELGEKMGIGTPELFAIHKYLDEREQKGTIH